jgi:hypothetical protein
MFHLNPEVLGYCFNKFRIVVECTDEEMKTAPAGSGAKK